MKKNKKKNALFSVSTRPSFSSNSRVAAVSCVELLWLNCEQNPSSGSHDNFLAVILLFFEPWAFSKLSRNLSYDPFDLYWKWVFFDISVRVLFRLVRSCKIRFFARGLRLWRLGYWLVFFESITFVVVGFGPDFAIFKIIAPTALGTIFWSQIISFLNHYLLCIYLLNGLLVIYINVAYSSVLNRPQIVFLLPEAPFLRFGSFESFSSNFLCFLVCVGVGKMVNISKSYAETLCTEPSNEKNKSKVDEWGSSLVSPMISVDGFPKPFKGKQVSESSGLDRYLSKMAKVHSNFQKAKESCLMGRIFGDPIDFPKIRNKLLSDWKSVKGEVSMVPKGNFWFEISFANPIDKKQVWDLRPYHVLGQLVILKQWKPNFNTMIESVTKLDLWVRIPLLPAEFSNKEAIQTIIEENKVGKFIKLDPYSMNSKIGSYMRICINIDVDDRRIINDVVPIPDENNDLKEYPIWFEDFSKGCGQCGEEDHSFDGCPLRNLKTKKVRINFKRNKKGNKNDMNVEDGLGDWTYLGQPKTKFGNNTFATGGFRPYLSGRGGISINFKSSASPGSSINSQKNSKASSNDQGHEIEVPEQINSINDAHVQLNISGSILPLNAELNVEGANLVSPNDEINKEDLFVPNTDPGKSLAGDEDRAGLALMNEGDGLELSPTELFENDIENNQVIADFMLTGDLGVEEEDEYFSDHSFQSFNTVNMLMNSMEVKAIDPSKSDSSKRRSMEVDEDTTSSLLKGAKKQKK